MQPRAWTYNMRYRAYFWHYVHIWTKWGKAREYDDESTTIPGTLIEKNFPRGKGRKLNFQKSSGHAFINELGKLKGFHPPFEPI